MGAFALLVASQLGCADRSPTAKEAPPIYLRELWAQQLPLDAGVPTGMTVVGDTIVTWSRSESALIVATAGTMSRISLPMTHPLFVDVLGDTLLVIETAPPQIRRLSMVGETLSTVGIAAPGPLRSAARVGQEWFFVSEEDHQFVLNRLRPGSSLRSIMRSATPVHLTATQTDLILAEARPPFSVRVYSVSDHRITRTHQAGGATDTESGPDRPIWVPLPAIALGQGAILQTLSDLTSDTRTLVRYSPEGERPARFRRIRLPMAFLTSDTLRRRIGAVRTLNVPEVVLYEIVAEVADRELQGIPPEPAP